MVAASCGFDVHFDIADEGCDCRDWRREVKLKRVAQIVESLIFSHALAGHIDLHALSDEPFPFLPDASGEPSFHTCSASRIISLKVAQRACFAQPWARITSTSAEAISPPGTRSSIHPL